jgi:hypothetical protein
MMAAFSSGHALVVAVGDYLDVRWNAPITVADGLGVAAALQDPTGSAYPSEQVTLLQGRSATRDKILQALQNLAHRVARSDTVTIFFCGHGAVGGDDAYHFATHESIFSDESLEAGTWLGEAELLASLRAIAAKKLLFIINACFSGHLSPSLGPPAPAAQTATMGTPPSRAFGLEVLATGEGRALITACRPTQYSHYLHAHERTFFGQALIDGLHGEGVPNKGGYVGLYELYEHLYHRVTEAAAPYGEQEPMLTILQGIGPFPVALYPGESPSASSAAPIQMMPPPGTAVDVVARASIQAGRLNIQGGGAVNVDQHRTVIDFGDASIHGSVKLGDVAGRDMTKLDVQLPSASASTRQNLLALIDALRTEISALATLPSDEREDVLDDLCKAQQAVERGNNARLVQRLTAAQRVLLSLGNSTPDAQRLGAAVGALLQRLPSL